MQKGISVIVCCYNSALRLPKTLEYLALQIVDLSISWEVIVVDNASTDNTKELANSLLKKFQQANICFRVVDQPKQGLSYAREKGISESQFEILIFCDDDNLLCNTYIASAYSKMLSDERIGAIGGLGKSFYPVPIWLGEYSEYYALGAQGKTSGDVTVTRGCLYGAGLVLRKSVITELQSKKFESIITDRKGKSLMSGGDTELTFAVRILGYKLYYESTLEFEHLIAANRFRVGYFIKLVFYIGYTWSALTPYNVYFNSTKSKYPYPNLGDAYYITKSLLVYGLQILKYSFLLKKVSLRKSVVDFIFKSGQLWFSLSKYKTYHSAPAFLKSK